MGAPVPPAGKPKILHVLGVEVDEGGVLSVIRSLHAAEALASFDQQTLVNDRYENLRKPALQLVRSRHIVAEGPTGALIWRGLRGAFELRRLIAANRSDVVHVHYRGALIPALLLGRLTGQRFLSTNHAYARRTGLYKFAASQRFVRTVLLTPNMARHYGLTHRPGKVDIVSACYEDAYLERPLVASMEESAARGVFKMIGVGSIVRWKNWGLLLEALHLLPRELKARIRFDHWGPVSPDADSQAFFAELQEKTARYRLGDIVAWRGSTMNVAEHLGAASVFLLPSNHEPCSVALMEALAIGLPAVVSRSGGNVDIIADNRTGALFEMNNPASLADVLTELATGKIQFAPPSAIRDSVRQRRASQVAQEYRAIYDQMTGI